MTTKPDYSRLPKSWGVRGSDFEPQRLLIKEKLEPILSTYPGIMWHYNSGNPYGITKDGVNDNQPDRYFEHVYTLEEFIALTELEEEFVLPEKWYIELTKENQSVVGAYYDRQNGGDLYSTCNINHNYKLSSHGTMPPNKSITEGNGTGDYFIDDEQIKRERIPEISLGQFQRYVLKQEPTTTAKTEPVMLTIKDTDKVVIPQELLKEGVDSRDLNTTMRDFIKSRIDVFTNEMEAKDVRYFYKNHVQSSCPWRLRLEAEFPFLKEPEEINLNSGKVDSYKLFEKNGNGTTCLIAIRDAQEYSGKGFYLNGSFNWEIKSDRNGTTVLVPTRK